MSSVMTPKQVTRALAVATLVSAMMGPLPCSAFAPQPLKPGPLVTMFSEAMNNPNPTQQAMLQVGQEMVADYVETNGNPYLSMVENAVVPAVDGYLQTALAPIAPVVAQITNNENATAEYIKEVDAALVDAIEESFLHPQNAQETVRAFSEQVMAPVQALTGQVRDQVVETTDERLHRLMQPFMPFAHLMGKDGDVDAWINAVDESLGNVIELQPLSEEAQALKELREVLMDPYHRAKLTTMGQIDSDVDCLDNGCEAGTSAAGIENENPIQRWYRRFWEVRNGVTGSQSIDDVLANANANAVPAASPDYAAWPGEEVPEAPKTIFEEPAVTKEHFQAHENKEIKTRARANLKMRLKSLLGAEYTEELLKMNPRFLLKHPNWASSTAAKLRENNPEMTTKEIAQALTDMLRMKRMKQQARILASKGCTAAVIEKKLQEYWVDNKDFNMQDVKC